MRTFDCYRGDGEGDTDWADTMYICEIFEVTPYAVCRFLEVAMGTGLDVSVVSLTQSKQHNRMVPRCQ